jgi:hypothetical protein
MKRLLYGAAWALLLMMACVVSAQTPELDRLDDKLRKHFEKELPDWSYKRIEPIQGSSGVLIQVWSTENRTVRIVVVSKKSAAEAKESMQNFPRNAKEARAWSDAGDEGYAWGYELRQIHFRRGKLIVDIEVGADVDADRDARNMTWAERRAREKDEIKKWSKTFSTHVVDTIDTP